MTLVRGSDAIPEMPHTKVTQVTNEKRQGLSLDRISSDHSQDGVAAGERNGEEGVRRGLGDPRDRNPTGVGYSRLLLNRVTPARPARRHIPVQMDSADSILPGCS